MEKVTIQEASRRLNLSQAEIRRYIRDGRLKAYREGGPRGQSWVVELPGDGWLDDFRAFIRDLDQKVTRWWWPNPEKAGKVHYVENMGIEEIEPEFLCGLVSENVWNAEGHSEQDRCPQCLEIAQARGLPLWPADGSTP